VLASSSVNASPAINLALALAFKFAFASLSSSSVGSSAIFTSKVALSIGVSSNQIIPS